MIAGSITGLSLAGVVVLGIVAIRADTAKSMEVLTAVLPVIGTWIGTVLAFYFGTSNFEAASRSALAIATQLTPAQRLKSKPVTAAMIPRSSMFVVRGPADKVVLADSLAALQKEGKGERIPVLDANDNPLWVVHRSTIDKFISDKALSPNPPNLTTFTLQDMLKDDEIKKNLETSFATVNQNATLAEAKGASDALPACQDVFVTNAGTKAEPVLGWITNNIIEDNAKV